MIGDDDSVHAVLYSDGNVFRGRDCGCSSVMMDEGGVVGIEMTSFDPEFKISLTSQPCNRLIPSSRGI